MPSFFLVKCTDVIKYVIMVIAYLVQFSSPKNADVDQLLGGWNATKQLSRMRDLHVTNLVSARKSEVDADAVRDPPLVIGIHTFAKWYVGKS